MLKAAIDRARLRIAHMLDNKVALTENVASAIQSFSQSQIQRVITRKYKENNQEKEKKIQLEHIQKIHAHADSGVNTNGHGVLIASIYEGDDGQLYKQVGKQWFYWDGMEWRE